MRGLDAPDSDIAGADSNRVIPAVSGSDALRDRMAFMTIDADARALLKAHAAKICAAAPSGPPPTPNR
jgi:hypothetical protein